VSNEDFHPDLRRIARFLPRGLVSRRTLPLFRALSLLHLPGRHDDVEVLALTTGAGVRVHRPLEPAATSGALLWIHGGGYMLGSARQDDELCRRLAQELGITVGSVEYRWAPEHPFPAALDDCYAALQRLVALSGVDPARVAIGGASAGGGLAAALALMTRDRGEINPALQLLTYPMLDDRTVAKSPIDARNYRLCSERSNRLGWAAYLGNANPDIAVPARNTDLTGLPPAWIGVGTHDLFHDEDLTYAERLKKAGVPCRVEVVPGAFHGFDRIVPGAPVSRSFFDSQCASLREALTAGSAA
jgi:acetyl esterase/lipase